jgi:putative hydrolase of the HAD superfamily
MGDPVKLQAIFFDIDDTLYSTTAFAEHARRNSIRAMIDLGLQIDPQEGYNELCEVIAEFSSNYEHHYDKLLARLPGRALVGKNPVLYVAAAIVAYHQTKFEELRLYPDVREVLERLSGSELKLGVITAGLAVKQAEKLIRLGVHRFIDPGLVLISEQVGISKPNVKLYLRACQQAGAPPAACLYVGDHPLLDVDPVNAAGMISVLIRRKGDRPKPKGRTEPRHAISDFGELLGLLQKHYRLPV